MTRRTPPPRSDAAPYRGRQIALGTRHGKQAQLAPAFSAVLGAEVVTPADLDTDRFGTFSGESPRRMSAMDAARAKAMLAVGAASLPFGLASEASYGTLPGTGWPGHEEILLFIDLERGIELVEGYRTAEVPGVSQRVTAIEDLPPSMVAGLADQALIVRPAGERTGIVKGITDLADLRERITVAALRSAQGLAVVEPDLRAHHNANRRRILARLGRALAVRLANRCPACMTPGFGRVDSAPGLPCRRCGTPTGLPLNAIHGCCSCSHTELHPMPGRHADPAQCPDCNP